MLWKSAICLKLLKTSSLLSLTTFGVVGLSSGFMYLSTTCWRSLPNSSSVSTNSRTTALENESANITVSHLVSHIISTRSKAQNLRAPVTNKFMGFEERFWKLERVFKTSHYTSRKSWLIYDLKRIESFTLLIQRPCYHRTKRISANFIVQHIEICFVNLSRSRFMFSNWFLSEMFVFSSVCMLVGIRRQKKG